MPRSLYHLHSPPNGDVIEYLLGPAAAAPTTRPKRPAVNNLLAKIWDLEAIEESLLAKEPLRQLAARFDTSTGALQRHKAEHLSASILKASKAAEAARGDNLLAKISDLEAAARRIAAKAEKSNDLRTAIVAIRELTRIVELLAKLRGELQQPQPVINVQVLAPVILGALGDFPEARLAVAARLQELDGSSTQQATG